jgi:NAD(P)-dependent dehydrogenase (short-subunit alcohol dehydrogenase family)
MSELTQGPLAGRTALVTGAGRGLGRAVAVGLARAGARPVLVARSADELAETAGMVDGDALVVVADLGSPAGIEAVLEAAPAVDVLVNNAAVVAPLGPSATVGIEEYAAALRVNVLAVAALSFALHPGMVERGWGRIVNVSSGIVARPAQMARGNAYVTTKAALEAQTVALAAELAGTGVTVNAYRPGSVDTAMQAWIRDQDPARIGEELHRRFVDRHHAGTLITPEQSAAVLLRRLLGEESGRIWDAAEE